MSSDSGITTKRAGEHLWIVRAPGERDVADVDALRTAFNDVFAQGSKLIVDLSDTTFIDSAVIGVIVEARRRANQRESDHLVVVSPPGTHPRRILDMTLQGIVPIADDLETALN
jgi:anti-anti-sigma factor